MYNHNESVVQCVGIIASEADSNTMNCAFVEESCAQIPYEEDYTDLKTIDLKNCEKITGISLFLEVEQKKEISKPECGKYFLYSLFQMARSFF